MSTFVGGGEGEAAAEAKAIGKAAVKTVEEARGAFLEAKAASKATSVVAKAIRARWPRITPGSLPAEEEGAVTNALKHIDNGTNPAWAGKWGTIFKNKGDPLPTGNTYKEYYVPKGPKDPTNWGPRRLVVGSNGSVWYTWDHYSTFVQVR
jgi:guanyl-specific ribonuclease Sa